MRWNWICYVAEVRESFFGLLVSHFWNNVELILRIVLTTDYSRLHFVSICSILSRTAVMDETGGSQLSVCYNIF